MTREEASFYLTNMDRKYMEEGMSEALDMAISALEQDTVSRDFQIGDEVRIIGSDPIYDDCDVGWVIRNASERVKTMCVMRNDGSADEEATAGWYKTGRHNAMLAEVIKALPSVTQKSGKWQRVSIEKYIQHAMAFYVCSECGGQAIGEPKFCPNCGACMKDGRTLDEFIEDSKESEDKE